MSLLTTAVHWAGLALELTLIAGLVARRRWRECYTFTAWLVVLAATSLTIMLCRSGYTWDFWIAKELVDAGITFGMALELIWRMFRPVPRAWSSAWLAVVVAVTLGATLVTAVPPGPVSVRVIPWIMGALGWLFTLLALITVWSKMPTDPLQYAILWGLPSYLVLYAVTWGQAGDNPTLPGLVNTLMFLLLLCAFMRPVWRRPTRPSSPRVEIGS